MVLFLLHLHMNNNNLEGSFLMLEKFSSSFVMLFGDVSAQERTSERNLHRRTRYAQMSPERKQLFLSELREKRAESKRQKHLHQSNTTAALTISSSSLSPQEVEASEATNLPVTLTTGHHQSNSTGALTISTSSLSPQQVEAFEVTNLPVNLTTGEHQLVRNYREEEL
ncbi:uncharacterized protein LOC107012815 isoform X4 [Solanum pennellii]|uniref:Uncharacterized protein LOC107012815 isoform X4 n=1 Tax=Solanum pennellii TaxID=28526 RepID=A0ABM1V5I5_SOLPN|nr:uncharacterized protein LOC107012815 isoform X4 [Solanum pennellii]XP_027771004.1 uncharacterized protein LOC107012815 isoform X4 [Solanum pennellii]